MPIGSTVGGAIGGVLAFAILVLLVLLIVFYIRRSHSNKKTFDVANVNSISTGKYHILLLTD